MNWKENENGNEVGEDTYAGHFASLAQVHPLSFLFSFSFDLCSIWIEKYGCTHFIDQSTETPLKQMKTVWACFGRRKMKRRESSDTSFGEVSRRPEPSLICKRSFKTFKKANGQDLQPLCKKTWIAKGRQIRRCCARCPGQAWEVANSVCQDVLMKGSHREGW